MKKLLALFPVILFQVTLYSQSARKPFRALQIFGLYNLQFLDVASFNRSLDENSLPQYGTSVSSLGIGGGIFFGKIYVGGQAAWQFGRAASNARYTAILSGANGLVKLGYAVVGNSSFIFYPTIGLGGGSTSIRLSRASNFTEVYPDGALLPGSDLHSEYLLADLGINVDFFMEGPRMGRQDENHSRALIGFTMGYTFSPDRETWRYGDSDITGLRTFAPGGPYIGLKLGWCWVGGKL